MKPISDYLISYRRSFTDAYEDVVGQIRDQLGLEPTGRPAKSTTSISEKLRRESIRLSQIQDIAGCRIIVPDILTQDEVVERLQGLFDRLTIVDRRKHPSHGYRAVHVVVSYSAKLMEVQVRTSLQHLWAELSEKLVTFESFSDSDRERAEESRLRLELDLNLKDIENEVVLLEAATEEALRRTHRRYFENLTELTTAPAT